VKQEPAVATTKKTKENKKRIGEKICFKHFSPALHFPPPVLSAATFPSAFCRCSVSVNF